MEDDRGSNIPGVPGLPRGGGGGGRRGGRGGGGRGGRGGGIEPATALYEETLSNFPFLRSLPRGEWVGRVRQMFPPLWTVPFEAWPEVVEVDGAGFPRLSDGELVYVEEKEEEEASGDAR